MTELITQVRMNKKFEYYSVHIKPYEDIVQILDDFGADGWEAFQMMQTGEDMTVYLKRELQ